METKKVIIGFSNGNVVYSDNQDYNYSFIRLVEHHLNELLKYRGFITLEDVLKNLGFDDRAIMEMIIMHGNYTWRVNDCVDIDINPYRKDLNLDPEIAIDVTNLDTF